VSKEPQADTELEQATAGDGGSDETLETGSAERGAADDIAETAADTAESTEDTAGADQEEDLSVDELRAQLDEARDAVLRAAAEAQNARRRAEQDVDKARKFALERMAGDLLPVVDNLERAVQAAAEATDAAAIAEGVDLTLRSFTDVLTKNGIEALDPAGEPFDPQLHQAMTMVPNPDMEPNTVMDVMQKGYTLNGRLLRPAMVVVSKAVE
jgi:molecular chaperone GrpE